jgi:hypothetical protein
MTIALYFIFFVFGYNNYRDGPQKYALIATNL